MLLIKIRWREEPTYSDLIDQIKDRKNLGEIPQSKKITDSLLIDQYWIQWLQINEKESYQKLLRHPLLTKVDYEKMQSVKQAHKISQVQWALGLSSASYLIYSLFFYKHRLFYNFFRKPTKYKIIPLLKKSLSSFTLFYSWFFACEYFMDNRANIKIRDEGLFQKYDIKFDL